MRLSDILKKSIQQKQNFSIPQKSDTESLLNQQKIENIIYSEDKVYKVVDQSEKKLSISVEEVYSKGIKLLRSLFKDLNSSKNNIQINDLIEVAKDITRFILDNNEEILLYTYYSTIDSYVYAHSLNVAIYSCVIAVDKKMKINEIEEIVLCGLLHDIGMARILNFVDRKHNFSSKEFEEVKKHSEYVKEEISKLNLSLELRNKITNVVMKVHERIDGSGYPLHLTSEDIDLYTKIISIVDVYEALSHPRPYRDRILPHDAIVAVVKQAQTEFDSNLVKIFVNRMSLFPVGSYVKLNTGEIARVISTNPSSPVRPKVKIILNSDGNASKKEEIIDLLEHTKISIVEAIDETKLDIKDKILLLQIKTQRWWVKDVTI